MIAKKSICILLSMIFILGSFSVSIGQTIDHNSTNNSTLLYQSKTLNEESDDLTSLIAQIKESTVTGYISSLVGFGPRVTGSSACENAGNYIASTFSGMGLDVVIQPWSNSGYQGENIEAILEGEDTTSDEIYIVCGHYDSVSGSPGADDNAAGTAAVLACAQVMSEYSFSHTVKFVAFSGEEQGLLGSEYYADHAANQNQNIVEVLNADMIGYALNDEGRSKIKVYGSGTIQSRSQTIGTTYQEYIDLTVVPKSASANSDHWPFIQNGYDAAMYHEYQFNDYYHSPQDTMDKMDMNYDMRVTRMILGTLASFADFIPPSEGGSGFLPLVVDVDQPVRDQVVNGTVTISGTAYHPEGNGNLDYVLVQIDDSGWEYTEGIVDWSYTWDTTTVNDGSHLIQVICSDGSLQSGTYFVPVTVKNQNTPPDTPTIINAPTKGYTNQEYTFELNTTDPDGDSIRYGFDWNNDNLIDDWTEYQPSGEPITQTHMWPWGSAGEYIIQIKAEDNYNDQSQFIMHNITIEKSDVDLPEVTIQKPNSNIYFNGEIILPFFSPVVLGSITVSISATDETSSIETVNFYINNEKKQSFSGDQEEYTWNWENDGFGRYTLKAEAIDTEGNINTYEKNVLKLL